MRTLFCSLLLVASLLLAPTAMAWDTPVSKASVTTWQEIVAIMMGWFGGSRELGPTMDPDGSRAAAVDPEGASVTYGWENDPDGGMGPAIDPEGSGISGEMGPGIDPEGTSVTYGQESGFGGDIGPAIDPEG